MTKKIMTEEELLSYMTEYLLSSLDELTELGATDGFVEGEITAFVDCLEILNFWKGFERYGITNIERKYQIR